MGGTVFIQNVILLIVFIPYGETVFIQNVILPYRFLP